LGAPDRGTPAARRDPPVRGGTPQNRASRAQGNSGFAVVGAIRTQPDAGGVEPPSNAQFWALYAPNSTVGVEPPSSTHFGGAIRTQADFRIRAQRMNSARGAVRSRGGDLPPFSIPKSVLLCWTMLAVPDWRQQIGAMSPQAEVVVAAIPKAGPGRARIVGGVGGGSGVVRWAGSSAGEPRGHGAVRDGPVVGPVEGDRLGHGKSDSGDEWAAIAGVPDEHPVVVGSDGRAAHPVHARVRVRGRSGS
jgi:hypothetical protein